MPICKQIKPDILKIAVLTHEHRALQHYLNLSSMVHQQRLNKSKIGFLASPCFLVYYNKKLGLSFLLYYSHSDIPFVAYKVQLIIRISMRELKQLKLANSY
jgi:hypothetical protein